MSLFAMLLVTLTIMTVKQLQVSIDWNDATILMSK